MLLHRIYAYLDQAKVSYQCIEQSQPGSPSQTEKPLPSTRKNYQLSKTAVLEIDNHLALLVLPASHQIDLKELCRSIRCYSIALPNDAHIGDIFHGCRSDMVPPFGHLYGLDVYLAESLSQQPDIIFCVGDQNHQIQIAYDQFAKLAEPIIVRHGCSTLPR